MESMRLVVERASREPEDARNYGRQAIVTFSPSNRLGGVDGASFCKRLTSQTENVSGRVHVTVMNRSAIATDPFSDSKVFQSLLCSWMRRRETNRSLIDQALLVYPA